MDKIEKALKQTRPQTASVEIPVPEPVINIPREEVQPQARPQTASVETPVPEPVIDIPREEVQPIPRLNPTMESVQLDALALERNRIISNASRKEIVQPYKVLRTRLLQMMKEKGWTTIAVTSPTKDDGKTTVAINLAISIAQGLKNSSVLLDLDLITPSVHTYFDYLPEFGLEEYLEKDAKLDQILVSPGIDGFTIGPSVRPLQKSSEHLACDPCRELIVDVKEYDPEAVILVDLPPVLASDDAIAMMPSVDAVLLVIREGKTNKQDVTRALELLENTSIAGIVLNDSVEPTELGYY